MKKSIFWVCLVCFVLCGCSVKESSKKYKICNYNVKIEEIYFNDAVGLQCSEANPYREQLLSQIELISSEESIDATEFEHEPEITLVTSKGITFELSSGVTHYPVVEGMEHENQDKYSYYIRILRNGERDGTHHYEWDEDVINLRQLMFDAMNYEYSTGIVTNAKGVITYLEDYGAYKTCGIESTEYGYQRVAVSDYDGVIVGDTVEFTILKEADESIPHAEYEGEIHNLTHNDVAATSEEYVTALPFTYNILSFELDPNKEKYVTGSSELGYEKELFDFVLDLYRDWMPSDVIQDIKDKYNEEFFEEYVLLYYVVDTENAQVTAVTQPKWIGGRNTVYVKENAEGAASDGKCHMIWVEIPRGEWNEQDFQVYVYE